MEKHKITITVSIEEAIDLYHLTNATGTLLKDWAERYGGGWKPLDSVDTFQQIDKKLGALGIDPQTQDRPKRLSSLEDVVTQQVTELKRHSGNPEDT